MASICILLLVIYLFWVRKRMLPVYLLDFQVYKPPDRCAHGHHCAPMPFVRPHAMV